MPKAKSPKWQLPAIIIISLVVVISLWWIVFKQVHSWDSVGALFSGLAFAGIIITILLQKEELSLQRKELEETRKELQRTADTQERSEVALNRQAENLKMSAKLTALNSLLVHYDELYKRAITGGKEITASDYLRKRNNVSDQIEAILEGKSDFI